VTPITYTGPVCGRPDCHRPAWRDGVCVYCWRLAKMFGKDLKMFVYQPLRGFSDERAGVALPWEEWERQARDRGGSLADLFADAPTADDDDTGPGGAPR